MKYLIVFWFILSCSLCGAEEQDSMIYIGHFSSSQQLDWEEKIFSGRTSYVLTKLDDVIVLKAQSRNAASGLFKKVSIDIKQYPYLNWRWRVEEPLSTLPEKQKEGDDYVARIYIVVSGGLFFWRTKALNYVWSSRLAPNDIWPNAFAPNNARMIAARTSNDQKGIWYVEKRNVYQALKEWLGRDVNTIDAIAIMTDTDNSHKQASAFYGDIYFSKK